MFGIPFAGVALKLGETFIGQKVKDGVGLLREIPQPVWEAFAVIGYALALLALHQHYANAALKAADQAGYERRASEDAAALIELQRRARTAEANLAKVSQDERTKNADANRAIAAHAGSLLAQGPGAASCGRVDHPAVPAAPSRPQPAPQPASAPAAAMPSEDGPDSLAAVSWRWLVGTGKQCDIERAENVSWRNAYQRWVAEWNQLKGGK